MRLPFVLATVLCAGTVIACATPPARTRAPFVDARATSSFTVGREIVPTSSFVWTKAHDGTTATLRVDENGDVLDRTPGIRIVSSQGEWTWSTHRIDVPTSACPDVAIPAREGYATTASISGAHGEQVVVRRKAESIEPLNEVTHTVDLLFSMGPLLFVEESEWIFACGAHGTETKSFFVWDVEKRERVKVLDQLPEARLRAAAKAELGGAAGGIMEPGEPEVTEIVPVLRDGHLVFDAQVTAPACYACGDQLWSSYTRSMRVTVDPPPVVARHARVPRGVARFASLHPDVTVGGFSRYPAP